MYALEDMIDSLKYVLFLFDPSARYGIIKCVSSETYFPRIYGFLPCSILPGGMVNEPAGEILI